MRYNKMVTIKIFCYEKDVIGITNNIEECLDNAPIDLNFITNIVDYEMSNSMGIFNSKGEKIL